MTDHAAYFAIPATNWSSLRNLAMSELAYKDALTRERAATPAQRLGTACHFAALEPDQMPLELTTWGGRRAGSDWNEFATVNADKTILTEDEYEKVLGVRDAVLAHRHAAGLLKDTTRERTVTWTDPETGIACKCRPDAYKTRTLADLKTTLKPLDARWIRYTVRDFDYLGQLAFYAEGLAADTGDCDWEAFLIGVEQNPPHDVGVFPIDAELLFAAGIRAHKLLGRLAAAQASDYWPGRYPEPYPITPLPWELDDVDVAESLGIIVGGSK